MSVTFKGPHCHFISHKHVHGNDFLGFCLSFKYVGRKAYNEWRKGVLGGGGEGGKGVAMNRVYFHICLVFVFSTQQQ